MQVSIKKVVIQDANRLTTIAITAKRYWGYPEAWIQLWTSGLTITTTFIESNELFKAVYQDKILGFCALVFKEDKVEIEHCWVAPAYIGHGIGQQLIEYALVFISKKAIQKVEVVSDPNAIGFYEKMGFKQIGTYQSQPNNRLLPLMSLM